MATFAYLRLRTASQTESGAGLDAQLEACTRAAGVLTGVYHDKGVSGKTGLDKRPALLEAITSLGKGDVLMVAKRDRLGRDPLVVAMIESAVKRKGAKIVSAAGEGTDNDSPADILMRRMVDAFSEYERLITGARTKSALQAKKSRGERAGYIPFGKYLTSDGVHLEDELEELETIKQIKEMMLKGLSFRKIATHLGKEGVFKRDGSKRNHVNLHSLCSQVT